VGILMHTQPGKNATRNVPQQKRYRVLRVDALGRPFVSPTAPASLTQARGGFAPVAHRLATFAPYSAIGEAYPAVHRVVHRECVGSTPTGALERTGG
jgi:hypothetical protein